MSWARQGQKRRATTMDEYNKACEELVKMYDLSKSK